MQLQLTAQEIWMRYKFRQRGWEQTCSTEGGDKLAACDIMKGL